MTDMDGKGDISSFAYHSPKQQLDPKLQHIMAKVARPQIGAAGAAAEVSSREDIAVVARVTSAVAWQTAPEVRDGAEIAKVPGEPDEVIVTGRIPARGIEDIRERPFVKSLKAAQRVAPALAASVDETGAAPALLPANTQSDGGGGVVVGIIDYGCDFAHRNFRRADGTTRLLALWDQSGPASADSPFGYGREFASDEIDAALQQSDPYGAIGYDLPRDSAMPRPGTHGTHVMDIAAGNGGGSGTAGFAPAAALIFVDVFHNDVPASGAGVVGANFGDSVRLLEAVAYIFEKAGDRPCVINISLGTNGGPHDGTTLVEQGIDSLIEAAPNRAVVIAAANAFADGIHAQGSIAEGGTADLHWEVPALDTSHNEVEIWFSGADRMAIEIILPSGQSLGRVEPGRSGRAPPNGPVEIFAANRLSDPNNGDNTIGVFLESGVPAGTWTLRLHGLEIADGRFHAWIERDNDVPSSFAPPHDNSHTIGSISCGRQSFAVASYDAHTPFQPISWFSSAGPTRDGRQKPEVSAPGHAVRAAHSRTGVHVLPKSGTSMAAPAVTGTIALMLAEAKARDFDLTAQLIRDILVSVARRDPPAGLDWDDRYGHGRIDASAAVAAVIQRASAPLPVG